jgi:hypothetical protein
MAASQEGLSVHLDFLMAAINCQQWWSSGYRGAGPTVLDPVSVWPFSCESRAPRAADTLLRRALRSLRRSPPASLADKAARTATARLCPTAGGQGSENKVRGVVGGAAGRSRRQRRPFPMQSALLRLKLVNSGAGTAQFFIHRCGCDYRPSPCLFPPSCRLPLSRAFKRRLQPRAATLTWPRVHVTAGRHGLAGLFESVQVNARIQARVGNKGLRKCMSFISAAPWIIVLQA